MEQVISYGTEGRRGDPEKEIQRTDTVYEYIVFRGSDVKDLRIEEPAKPQAPKPQVPDDPAILGVRNPPSMPRWRLMRIQTTQPANYAPRAGPPTTTAPQMPPQPQFQQPPGPPFYGQPPMRPPPNQFYNPYQQQQPQYGAFMQQPPAFPSQIAPPQHPGAVGGRGPAPGQFGPGYPPQQQQPPQTGAPPSAPGPAQPQQAQQPAGKIPTQSTPPVGSKSATPAPHADGPSQAPAKEADKTAAPPTGPSKGKQAPPQFGLKQGVPSGPKNARPNVAPALPLASPARQAPAEPVAKPVKVDEIADKQSADAAAVQELAKKVSQLNVAPSEAPKVPQGPANGTRANGSYSARGGGRGRGGFRDQASRKVEVPPTDYDFDAANAKFNKQDLVKEVIATGPAEPVSPVLAANGEQLNAAAVPDVAVPVAEPSYNRGKSFFDNISCENKDRAEGNGSDARRGWRGEEQRKNLETFGQGSVDNYGRFGRGGWRGRGRGGYRRGGGFGGGRGGGNFNNRGQQTVGQ